MNTQLCTVLLLAMAAGTQAVSAGTQAAAGADGASLRCSGQAATPGNMTLQLGKSTLMRMPEAVQARSVGNPAVLQAMLVAPDTLYLVGVDIGTSNMIVQGRSGMCNVIEVVVGIDPGALQASLAALMPEQKDISVSAAGDTLVISGMVDDTQTAARVLELAAAFVRRPAQALEAAKGDKGMAGAVAPAGSTRIVNFLNISAPQQVMLEVKVAEVSKTLLDKLEAVTGISAPRQLEQPLTSNFLSGTLKGLAQHRRPAATACRQPRCQTSRTAWSASWPSRPSWPSAARKAASSPAARSSSRSRRTTTMAPTITLEEKEFGVGLRFTPTVLAGGRINLRVAPEVSELSREGIGIGHRLLGGTAILPSVHHAPRQPPRCSCSMARASPSAA
jgi:pilus assembly protein CpaC